MRERLLPTVAGKYRAGRGISRSEIWPIAGKIIIFAHPRRGARVVEEARLESSYTSKAYQGFESPSLRKRPGGRLGCKRYSFATFLLFGGNEFIRNVSGSSVVRTADGRVLAGICGSSVGRGKAGRNSIFVLSVGSWEKLLSGVSKSTTR